jgi:hypothetical protein
MTNSQLKSFSQCQPTVRLDISCEVVDIMLNIPPPHVAVPLGKRKLTVTYLKQKKVHVN